MRKWAEDLEEEGVDLDRVLVDQDRADVQHVDIQLHIHEEHHVLQFPAPSVVQD